MQRYSLFMEQKSKCRLFLVIVHCIAAFQREQEAQTSTRTVLYGYCSTVELNGVLHNCKSEPRAALLGGTIFL